MMELLVAGFIRNIEKILSKRKGFNNTIPLNINILCNEFYSISIVIFLKNNHLFHALNLTNLNKRKYIQNLLITNPIKSQQIMSASQQNGNNDDTEVIAPPQQDEKK
eukprot:171662_1